MQHVRPAGLCRQRLANDGTGRLTYLNCLTVSAESVVLRWTTAMSVLLEDDPNHNPKTGTWLVMISTYFYTRYGSLAKKSQTGTLPQGGTF